MDGPGRDQDDRPVLLFFSNRRSGPTRRGSTCVARDRSGGSRRRAAPAGRPGHGPDRPLSRPTTVSKTQNAGRPRAEGLAVRPTGNASVGRPRPTLHGSWPVVRGVGIAPAPRASGADSGRLRPPDAPRAQEAQEGRLLGQKLRVAAGDEAPAAGPVPLESPPVPPLLDHGRADVRRPRRRPRSGGSSRPSCARSARSWATRQRWRGRRTSARP